MSRHHWLERVRFGADGLAPVVAQDRRSGDVLMVAWANLEALRQTLESGQAHYWSRSRQTLWRKGESSGNHQRVIEVRLDCDGDTILYGVEQHGPACHSGQHTCFFTVLKPGGATEENADPGGHLLTRLAATVARRASERPHDSYTVQLLEKGVAGIAQKVGEEAVEVVVAATAEDENRLAAESADLLYHLLVLLQARGVTLDDVLRALEARER